MHFSPDGTKLAVNGQMWNVDKHQDQVFLRQAADTNEANRIIFGASGQIWKIQIRQPKFTYVSDTLELGYIIHKPVYDPIKIIQETPKKRTIELPRPRPTRPISPAELSKLYQILPRNKYTTDPMYAKPWYENVKRYSRRTREEMLSEYCDQQAITSIVGAMGAGSIGFPAVIAKCLLPDRVSLPMNQVKITRIGISPSGRYLAVVYESEYYWNHQFELWDLAEKNPHCIWKKPFARARVKDSPDLKSLLGNTNAGQNSIGKVFFSKDEKQLMMHPIRTRAGRPWVYEVYDIPSRKRVYQPHFLDMIPRPFQQINNMRADQTVSEWGKTGTAKILKKFNVRVLDLLDLHHLASPIEIPTFLFAIGPNKKILIGVAKDRQSIVLLKYGTGKEFFRWQPHKEMMTALAFIDNCATNAPIAAL